MAETTGSWLGFKRWSRSSKIGRSEVVLEGGSRFGSSLALPASHGLDGAAKVWWWSFNGVRLMWIDVESTGAASSWLDNGGKVMAVRIGIGVGLFLALIPWGIIGGGCGSGDWFWCCMLVMAAPGGWSPAPWLLPVSFRVRNAFFGGLVPMMAVRPVLFFFSLSHFQFCDLVLCYCLRLIVLGWIICHFVVLVIDRLLWSWADGGGPMQAALLLVGDSGRTWKHNTLAKWLSLFWSATCSFNYAIVIIFRCILFPTSPSLQVLKFYGLSFGCHTVSGLAVMVRWRTTIKWLLPPSVRMKCRVFKLFYGFEWMHEEIELLTSLLCLCVGEFSSMDSCYFKTIRVAICALIVFRASVNSYMITFDLKSLSLLLRVLFCMFVVIIHEVRFYAPLVVYVC